MLTYRKRALELAYVSMISDEDFSCCLCKIYDENRLFTKFIRMYILLYAADPKLVYCTYSVHI